MNATVLLLSEQGKVLDAHPSSIVLLQWQPDDLVGKAAGDLFDKGVDLLLAQLLQVPDPDEGAEPSRREPVDVVALRRDGTTFAAKLTLRRWPGLNCWTVVIRRVDAGDEDEESSEPGSEDSQSPGGAEAKPGRESGSAVLAPPTRSGVAAGQEQLQSETPEPASHPPKRRDMLVARILANETELHFLRVELERERSKRRELEQKMGQLRSVDGGSQKPPAAAPAPIDQAGSLEEAALKAETASANAELEEMQKRLREGVASLARITAELERERGDRRRNEERAGSLAAQLQALHHELGSHLKAQQLDRKHIKDLEQQQRELEHALNQARADLQKEATKRELAEKGLRGVGDLSARVEANLEAVQQAGKAFKEAKEQLENVLSVQMTLEPREGTNPAAASASPNSQQT